MIVTLRHSVEIDATPESVWVFFDSIENNYTKWHPDHVMFRWVEGKRFEKSAVAYTEQNVHGSLHKMKVKCTCDPKPQDRFRVEQPTTAILRAEERMDFRAK